MHLPEKNVRQLIKSIKEIDVSQVNGSLKWFNSNISEAETMKKEKIEDENLARHLFLGFIYVIRYNMRASASQLSWKYFTRLRQDFLSLQRTRSPWTKIFSSHFPMLLNMVFHTREKLYCTMCQIIKLVNFLSFFSSFQKSFLSKFYFSLTFEFFSSKFFSFHF